MSDTISYGHVLDLERDWDGLRDEVEAALKEEGFGILTEIDVKETLEKKLGVSVPRQLILGACNPPLAHQAMETEADIGLLLPCNVTLRELPEGRVRVAAMNVARVSEMIANPKLADTVGEVDARLRKVLERLGA